ncbi:MAG: glyoxylate/hydroxypyruvate reductase A [Parvibaculum sedimenti]|uniref:2-hydroxyacid dehydrogenase n=1 Tax=Parvibaculum sedimenti TaxID=2608632 RepID=UPI003BB6FA9E
MRKPIALVTRIDEVSEQEWRALIAELLPEESIQCFRDMSDIERKAAEIAIVANPDPAHVAELSGLSWIHSLWAGVERLVAELGVGAPPIVRLVDPELSRVMAEAVLAWTLYLHRDMPAYARQQRDRVWIQQPYRHPSRLTVGILGLGALGMAAAERLSQSDFAVKGWSRSPKDASGIECFSGDEGLNALLGGSDVVVCLMPLTNETRGLLDKARFAVMKEGAALINFARGAIIVDTDLIASLNAGHLSHAVLDVFQEEPLPAASPFWHHPKVTVLPHISAPTDPHTAAAIVANNIRAYRTTGQLPQTVDIRRGY